MSARLTRKLGKETATASITVLNEIIELLNKDLQSSTNNMRKEVNYTDPSWGYRQADYLGEQRAYKKVIDLLTVK